MITENYILESRKLVKFMSCTSVLGVVAVGRVEVEDEELVVVVGGSGLKVVTFSVVLGRLLLFLVAAVFVAGPFPFVVI